MGQDNVDVFKKIVFSIPSSKKTIGLLTISSIFYSVILYLSLRMFAGNLFSVENMNYSIVPIFSLAIFLLPSIISAEAIFRLNDSYERNWSYFLAAINSLLLFIYSLIFSGANSLPRAWNVFWLGLITLYITNFVVMALTEGKGVLKKISVLSTIQPICVLISFHVIVWGSISTPIQLYLVFAGISVLTGIIIAGILATVDYLMGSNLEGVSALELASGILQKKQESLDLGYPTEAEVQTLKIENQNGETTLAIPWLHPGPLEGFGGGRLTTEIIERLNKNGEGFFLHFPSTHKSDPCSPEASQEVLDSLNEPQTQGEASKLFSKNYRNGDDEVTFYGRKIGEQNIVFMDARGFSQYDDFEISVFREVVEPEKTTLIDLHNQKDGETRQELWYNTRDSKFVREKFADFVSRLEEQELGSYRAGFNSSCRDKRHFVLVEEVSDQKTLIFGVDGNDATEELLELEEEFSKHFDEVLLFTTDSHQSIHQLSSSKQAKKPDVRRSVEKAVKNVSVAEAGLGFEKTSEINLLREDYSGLIHSVNILVRLLPLTLILLYLTLIVWVF